MRRNIDIPLCDFRVNQSPAKKTAPKLAPKPTESIMDYFEPLAPSAPERPPTTLRRAKAAWRHARPDYSLSPAQQKRNERADILEKRRQAEAVKDAQRAKSAATRAANKSGAIRKATRSEGQSSLKAFGFSKKVDFMNDSSIANPY